MPGGDALIVMSVGVFFLIPGIILWLWVRAGEKKYYNSLAANHDVREYMEHVPEQPALGGLKIGGWIAIAVGLALVVMGGIFWLWG